METQTPVSKAAVLRTMWQNWRRLQAEQREQIASQLGPVGRVLTIASNLQDLAHSNSEAGGSVVEDEDDDDIIDVEFVER